MRKFEWLVVIVFSGLGVILLGASLGNFSPLVVGLVFLFVSQVVTASNCLYAGWPGIPKALDEAKFYRLMGQVKIDENTTIVVLTNAKGKVFCVENPDKPFPERTEFVRTRKLFYRTWIIETSPSVPLKNSTPKT